MTTEFGVLATIGITILTQLLKGSFYQKYGKTGVHVIVAILALVVVVGNAIAANNVVFATAIKQAGVLLVSAVGLYEVILSKLKNKF